MDNVFDTFLGLLLGAIGTYWVFTFFRGKKTKEITTHQSTVLLEKMKSVCKLISVEGEFAEIYKYENVKDFMSLVSSKKKALVVIKAKAHIGYDLSKLMMHADEEEALETVLIMEKIVETIGWKLDYSTLKIPQQQIEKLVNQR